MAQGFISGFLRGLGTGAVMLSALSIYVGINAQGDHETDRLAATDQGLQSQPPVQNELSQNNADTDPTTPETPAVGDSEIQADKNTDAGSESQETSELTQNSSTDDAGDGQVDENQSQIQAANLPDEPIIAQIPNNPKGIEQPDVTALPGPPSDSAANQPIAMPVDPDPNENALSELDQMVVIKPDNKIAQNEPLVPNAAEPQTPVLPLTPSAPGLPSRDENNRSNVTRDYAAVETPVAPVPQIAEPLTENPLDAGRAIQLYASNPENVDGRPLVALALVATDSVNLTKLDELSYPVTVAIAADHPDAMNWIEALRRRDQEVAVTLDLANAATFKDIETNLTAILSKLNKTVAVMEKSRGGLQQSRTQNQTVPDVLSRSGHGLITYRNGLNSIQKNARNVGLFSAIVAENLVDLSPSDMQRRLDRVLLEATKEGSKGALIVAPISDPVLQLISEWSAQDRAQRVQFVPVSQYLTLVSQD